MAVKTLCRRPAFWPWGSRCCSWERKRAGRRSTSMRRAGHAASRLPAWIASSGGGTLLE